MRCLVADDHPALAAVIATLLTDAGYEVVGPAADGETALALAAEEQPDVAVVDYRMPGIGGCELVERLKDASPGVRVLVYTAEAGETVAQEALARGADGILLKEAPLADVARALDTLKEGRSYVDPALAAGLVGVVRDAARPALTERERDVLGLLANGRSHEEIGAELGIGIETVRTHLRKACDRLGAATRTQAVATALRLGLID
jgi:two-component system nitrate/nitrite response regulator NarL